MTVRHPGMRVENVQLSYRDSNRINSRDHVLEIIQFHLDRCVQAVPFEADDPFAGKFRDYSHEFTASDVLARVRAGSARVRVREFPLMTLAYVGQVTALALSNMIHAALHAQARAVADQQSNGVWVPVAWRARTEMVQRTARTQVRTEPASLSYQDAERGVGWNPGRFEETAEQTERVVVSVVWWDATDGENIDMAAQYTDGRVAGTIGPALVSRALRAEIDKATDILQEWSDSALQSEPLSAEPEAAVVPPVVDKPRDEVLIRVADTERKLVELATGVEQLTSGVGAILARLEEMARAPARRKRGEDSEA